jgi:hypothetical protein
MQLDYHVVYSSRRKKLTITVERDRSVVVKAPEGTSQQKIDQLVESRKQWLYEKIHYSPKYPSLDPPGKELVNGESLLYLGRQYPIKLVDTVTKIQFSNNCFLVPQQQYNQSREIFKDWYIQRAKENIPPRVDCYAQRLGVEYNQVKVINSKYRWGSCTPKNNLTFNWRLIKAPMFVIDYVVVHELAHLLEPNHTPRFWNIIKAQITNMEKAKYWLKNNGAILEQKL